MKILILGLDSTILNPDSPVAGRFREYGEILDQLDILVPGTGVIQLATNVTVFGVEGKTKIGTWFEMKKKAEQLLHDAHYELISTKDTYFLGILAVRLAKRYGLGLEIQIHGFEKGNLLRNIVAGWVLRQANALRVVSGRLKEKVMKNFKIPTERITVVPIFIDGEAIMKRVQVVKKKESQEFTFITVGRLVPVKNIAMQLEVMRKIVFKYPTTKLMIVGGGPLEARLRAKAKSLDLDQHVTFTGHVKAVTEYLVHADCFLLTSDEEGYGLAPIEAACAGLPVIMTDVGCAGEVIKDHENGIVIPVRDEKRLFESMETVLTNSELSNRFRENNKNICLNLLPFSETLELYRKSWQRAILKK